MRTETLETMTPQDVADALKMHPRTVKRWMATGKLPGFQLQSGTHKGDWRARRSDVEAWMTARQGDTSEA